MDKWLLDRLNSITLKLQKRGYLLTTLHVNVAGFTFISSILSASMLSSTTGRIVCMSLNGAVWGSYLWGTQKWALANQDYPQSLKMVDKLNAVALEYRETEWLWRMLAFWSTILQVPGALVAIVYFDPHTLANIVAMASIWLTWGLNGCFFVGPGQFASKQREQVTGDMVMELDR